MSSLSRWLSPLPWSIVIVACLTLGLAPFHPPHVWEKILMLQRGELVRPIDWFDLVLHGSPWLLLLMKLCCGRSGSGAGSS